jgi:hypothetical protein
MKNRISVLETLIGLTEPIEAIRTELSVIPWDSEEELIELKASDLVNVLQRYIDGDVTKETLIEWANVIEGRDDIGLEKSSFDTLKEALTVLANPDINGPIDKTTAALLVKLLQGN